MNEESVKNVMGDVMSDVLYDVLAKDETVKKFRLFLQYIMENDIDSNTAGKDQLK